MFDSSLFIGEDVRFKSSMCRRGASHSLHKIFQYMAHGYSPKRMREMEPDLLPETIIEARSILVDRSRDFFPETVCEAAPKDLKILIDENISPAVAGFLRTNFRKVSHVNDVGLTGRKDDKVWAWAIENGYQIIFTVDSTNKSERDLTYIATEEARGILRSMDNNAGGNLRLTDLPLIVHLPGGAKPEIELKKLLRQSKDKFLNYLSDRVTTFIDVRNAKITCGPTYFELRGGNYIQDNEITGAIFQRKKESREFFKALWLGHLSANEIRNMPLEREAFVDRKIDNYFARLQHQPAA